MADKTTVTLWPPEHGAKPHIPIEVQPGAVEGMKAKGWRDTDPNPQAENETKPPAQAPPRRSTRRKKDDTPPGESSSPSA